MIALPILALLLALVAYAVTSRLSRLMRVLFAVAVFLLVGVAPLVWLVSIGDRAPEDSTVVTPDTLDEGATTPANPVTPAGEQ